jgi:hypothetical protein
MFSEGREDVENDKRPGHSVMMKTDVNVEKVKILFRTYHCLGIKMMAAE